MGGVLADQLLALWSTQRSSLPVCRSCLAWLRANGNSLDLDQHVRPEEPAHLDERARRRTLRVDVLVTDRPHRGDVAHVGEEVVQLDDVAPAGVRRFERAGQVLEHLSRLGVEVSLADESALAVERDLARGPCRARLERRAAVGTADGGSGQLWMDSVFHIWSFLRRSLATPTWRTLRLCRGVRPIPVAEAARVAPYDRLL